MQVDIRFRGLEPSPFLKDFALRQVQFHLSRFGEEVTGVLVRVSDVNGPRGGLDKRCQISVRGPKVASNVESQSGDAYAAVDLAVKRLARTLRRHLERLHALQLEGPSLRRAL
jgi:putative sigma-54 modulation protein